MPRIAGPAAATAKLGCPRRADACNPLAVRWSVHAPAGIASPDHGVAPQIALGDQREAEPISERSRCGPVRWTVRPIGRLSRTVVPAHTCGYFFGASLALAGVAATQAPLPSLPPFSSHFILAF